MIKLNSLHKFFNKGRQNEIHVINDISLELPERGMVAIFGKSGCGKTTLLNVIGGLDGFASGSITVEGQDVRRDPDAIRNRYMGYIFQNYNLNKTETCYENVAAALRLCGMTDEGEIEGRVMAALSNVGMENYRKRTPDTLSGGQHQRIAIARAIVKNPRIILADEPTGNLDEANTVMIMDLLKQIAKDHLVLLVTHEANLVDYYCDTVIELSDGKVMSVKQNQSANGFAARDKNDIYLGELEKTELASEHAEIAYYGDAPDIPVKVRIVRQNGKMYLSVDTPGVQILDTSSEVKLREGIYEQRADANRQSESIDMSKLPPVEGTHFGKLFGVRSSIRSGYTANFKKHRRGGKLLRRCMSLFAAVVVLMSAVFGTSIADIIDVKKSYNHNVFYVYTPDGKVSGTLAGAMNDPETGIDYIRLSYDYPSGDSTVKFMTGFFETFQSTTYDESFETNAVYLDISHGKDLPLIEGKKDDLSDWEAVITTRVADALLEKSSLGYITEYRDLLGMINTRLSIDGKNICIAGVVASDEPTVYMSELGMAKYVHKQSGLYIEASDEIKTGETQLIIRSEMGNVEYPDEGKSVLLHGKEFNVTEVVRHYTDYRAWLDGNGIKKYELDEYIQNLVKKQDPTLMPDKDAANALYEKLKNENFVAYYDYYYDHLDEFLRDYAVTGENNVYVWLYLEKGAELVKYTFAAEEYYKAKEYEKQYGKTPTYEELTEASADLPNLPDVHEQIKNYLINYEEEFYKYSDGTNLAKVVYLVSPEDYIALARTTGETDPSAFAEGGFSYGIDYEYAEKGVMVDQEIIVDSLVYSSSCFTVVHSNDPAATEAYLEEHFSDLDTGVSYIPAILTPNRIFETRIESYAEEIIISLITMAVILAVMSLCMYFIMRSSLMNRVKEVGIYRAIGVSRKNLIFKFFVEAIVLTTLTVLVGYLLTSAFMWACLGMSAFVEQFFFYPLWLAALDLVILYLLCLVCGTLPILSLLRKTPSEILAKYDI